MKRFWGLVLLLVLGGLRLAEAEPLSLSQIYALVEKNHPLLKAARKELEAAQAGVRQAKGAFWPRIDLRELYARTDSPVQVFSYKLAQENFKAEDFLLDRLNHPAEISNWKSQLVVTQPLFNQGREILGLAKARLSLKQARFYLEALKQRLFLEAERAYLRVLLAQQRVEVLKKAVETARAHLKLATQRYKAGKALKSDLLEAQVYLARQEKELAAAEHQLKVALSELNLALGFPLGTSWEIKESLFHPPQVSDLSFWIKEARERRPDLKLEASKVKEARLGVKEARWRFLPSVNLKGIYEKNAEGPFSGGADGEAYLFMAELNWNLFRGFQDQAALSQARARLLAQESRFQQYQRQVEHQVREAYSAYQTALKELEVTKKAVAQAQEGLRILQERYTHGLSLLVELLQAQTALKRAQLLNLEARYQVQEAWARLRYMAGRLTLEGGRP